MNHIVRDWVSYHAARTPDAAAVSDLEKHTSLTWGQLEGRVGALAHVLRVGLKLRQGDRVALISDNDTRIFELQFACMRAGLILVPLNWRLTAHELTGLLRHAEPSALVHDSVWEAKADELAAALGITRRLAWDCSSGVTDFDGAILDAGWLDAPSTYAPETVTHVMYTSGTTGMPKGAMCTHGTLMWQALNLAQTSRMAERGGHHLNMVPLFHAGGLNVYSNPMLFWGGHVSTINRFDPAFVLDLLADESVGITHLCGVLQMYEMITALPRFADARFSALRCGLFGGWGPQTRWVHEQWRERGHFLQLSYGATELGPNVTVLQSGADQADRNSSGPVMPFTEIRLVDPDGEPDGRPVGAGDVGEIWVRGPAVTPGYWGRERDEFFTDGWFRTGDCGRFDEHGHLFVVDRLREVYRSGGENVYPAEVENVLAEIPEIRELAIIGVPDQRWGEVGLAVVVPTAGADVTLEILLSHASTRLAKFKLPKHIAVVDELPRNVTMKIARDQLRTEYASMYGAIELVVGSS
jgi:fatty-acyl-CoA synthase